RSADGWPETVVDLQPMAAYGGRSADIVSACRGGTAATVWLAATTVADVPPMHHRSRRSSGSGSTAVSANTHTVVDPPTRHADEMSAQRPPSAATRGRSTTVSSQPSADRPPSQTKRGRSTTVTAEPVTAEPVTAGHDSRAR